MDDEVQRGKPIGRISSRHIISSILDFGYPYCMQKNASQMMDGVVMPLEMDSPLRKALEVFKRTGFAFVPIVVKSDDVEEGSFFRIAASLAIRDILPLLAKANLGIPVKEFASQLISVNNKSSIRNALNIMLDKSIKNIGITGKLPYHDSSTRGGERSKEVASDQDSAINHFVSKTLSFIGLNEAYNKNLQTDVIKKYCPTCKW